MELSAPTVSQGKRQTFSLREYATSGCLLVFCPFVLLFPAGTASLEFGLVGNHIAPTRPSPAHRFVFSVVLFFSLLFRLILPAFS